MAIYRLSVQTIRRGDGRSVVAAAAYRAGVRLHDARLEMDFDFRRKEGVEHREVTGPVNTPAALLEREALWNAAEKADRRKDSVPAQEVLIALPYELNAEQRRDLVRTFVRESLVSRGMIADFNIHQPDPQGDERNFHAHILVTTRDVGPEGFGKKNPDWNHASFVSELRHEWARIQNREMQRHLGAEAPRVSELSRAARGLADAPQPKMGPSATAMERRGEVTELGAWRKQARLRARESAALDRELGRQMSPKNTPYRARSTADLLHEMESVVDAMRAERDVLSAHRETLKAPPPPSKRTLENALTRRGIADRRCAQAALKHAEVAAIASGISPRLLAQWFTSPGTAFMATIAGAHRGLDRLDAARKALEKADRALAERRAWVRSEDGQAHVANLREPGVRASVEAAQKRRTVDRKVKRLDARIRRAEGVVRDLSIAKAAKVEAVRVPEKAPADPRRGTSQDLHIAAIGRPVRAVVSQMPKAVIELALRSLTSPTPEPPGASLGRDDGLER
jgi:hypothetical protein